MKTVIPLDRQLWMAKQRQLWRNVTIVERFVDDKGINRERLSCGHIRTDNYVFYGNETSVKIKRVFELFTPNKPVRARCYKCKIEEIEKQIKEKI